MEYRTFLEAIPRVTDEKTHLPVKIYEIVTVVKDRATREAVDFTLKSKVDTDKAIADFKVVVGTKYKLRFHTCYHDHKNPQPCTVKEV